MSNPIFKSNAANSDYVLGGKVMDVRGPSERGFTNREDFISPNRNFGVSPLNGDVIINWGDAFKYVETFDGTNGKAVAITLTDDDGQNMRKFLWENPGTLSDGTQFVGHALRMIADDGYVSFSGMTEITHTPQSLNGYDSTDKFTFNEMKKHFPDIVEADQKRQASIIKAADSTFAKRGYNAA